MSKRGGAVHVATTRRRYQDKVYETHLLRRTFREGGKVKHETLANLSHLPPHAIETLRRSLAGETLLPAEKFRTKRSRLHGHVEAVLGAARKLGLDALIACYMTLAGKHGDPVEALDLAMNPPPEGQTHFADGQPSYETILTEAHPQIAAFGGMFLLLLFLNFVLTERPQTWLTWLEKPLAEFNAVTI